jgi:thiol-disulfide isomerase/thioredoxin
MLLIRRFAPVSLALLLSSCAPVPAPNAPSTPVATADPEKKNDEPKSAAVVKKDDDSAKQAAESTKQAYKAAENGNTDEAMKQIGLALKADPAHREALFLKAVILQNQAMEEERPKSSALFLEAAETMRKLSELHKELNAHEKQFMASVLYNEACTYAVEGKKDKAIETLEMALKAGPLSEDLFDDGHELDSIRDLPRFKELRRKAGEVARAQAKVEAKTLLAESKPFKFDFTLEDTAGKTVALADFKGKVTIVDVWGTWCPPCRKEVPHFVALLDQYRDKGLAVIGLNYERVDKKEAKEAIETFIKEHKVNYPCVIGDDKTQDKIPNLEGFPTTLFLDREGTVRLKLVGYHSRTDLEAIVQMLLDEKPSKPAAGE